jgi:hypothetical protein
MTIGMVDMYIRIQKLKCKRKGACACDTSEIEASKLQKAL